jgi:hypothetical protein
MANEKNPIEAALEKRNEADFQAFLKLRELVKMTDYNPGKQKLIKILAEYSGDEEEAEEFVKELAEVVQAREDANEEFLQAIKDNPIQINIVKQ